ncbi:MAG: YegS/Rv2252/BmrU family lipid kinase [Chitinophagales bacterium]|nr:YegS/Rv2252/BmrU family lipid kinase [Chitinophagales bacterium]MCZ2393562.1 YegS/Rv2252/BmrU family lipid kinase [Chitinophagales bacterium]
MADIAFFINKSIAKWEKTVNQIQEVFSDSNISILYTEYSGHLPVLVESAIQQGYKNLIVAGGDGSINELLNGLVNTFTDSERIDWEKISEYTLGIIPSGTGNDFCKTLKCPMDLVGLKAKIDLQQKKLIDIGQAEFTNKNLQDAKRYYINITDVGMGGDVVSKLEKERKILPKALRYQVVILKTFFTYQKSQVRITGKDYSFEGKIMNVVVANGKYFGNGLGVAPTAELQDGLMDIVVLGDLGIWDYLTHLGQVKDCKTIEHQHVQYHQANEISITSSDNRQLPVDMDGEFIGYAPLKIINLSQRVYFYS